MWVIGVIIIGFVVGLIARFLMPGRDAAGFVMTTLLGIGGAFLATVIGQTMGFYFYGEPAGFIASVIGAMLILFVARLIKSRS